MAPSHEEGRDEENHQVFVEGKDPVHQNEDLLVVMVELISSS